MHNLCCDNCHSHVARALNIMQYDGSTRSSHQHKNMNTNTHTNININMQCEDSIIVNVISILLSQTKQEDIFNFFLCSWNMVTLCALMLVHGKHLSWCGNIFLFLTQLFHNCFSLKCSSNPHERCGMVRTWLPSFVLLGLVAALVILTNPTRV